MNDQPGTPQPMELQYILDAKAQPGAPSLLCTVALGPLLFQFQVPPHLARAFAAKLNAEAKTADGAIILAPTGSKVVQ